MVNTYLKAAILTIVIVGAWFGLSIAFETQLNNQLLNQIDTIISQETSINAYLAYLESTEDNQRYCTVLKEHVQIQSQKLFALLEQLERTQFNTLENQYPIARQRFQNANAQLFFSLKKFEQNCPNEEELKQPILYFYPDNQGCSDCVLQASILNEIRDACLHPIQIFAFPTNGESTIVELLIKDYQIEKTPSLVIEDKVYEGVQSPSFLNEKLNC